MKRIFFVSLVIFAGCSSIQTSYDFDNTIDFSKYKTYAWTEDAMKLPVQELDRQRIISAVDAEMAAKGFTKASAPDILLDLQVKLQQTQSATATNTGVGYYGGPYRYGWGAGYGGTTQINIENHVEGTLFINMIDRSTEKLAWQGRGVKTLDENASPEKKDTNIKYAVKTIFSKYPPVKKK